MSKRNTELLRLASLVGTDAKDPEQKLMQYIRGAIERAYRSTQTSSVAEGLVTATFSTGTADEMYANLLRELGLDNA